MTDEHFQETYFRLPVDGVVVEFGRCQPSGRLARRVGGGHEYLSADSAALTWALHYAAVDYWSMAGHRLQFRVQGRPWARFDSTGMAQT